MELDRQLNQPGSGRADYPSEVRIVDFSVHRGGTVKLCVVEYVESFHPDIARFRFCETHRFADLHIEVRNAWAVKETPGRVTQLSKCLRREESGVEFRPAIAGIRIDLERTLRELRGIQQFIIDAVAQRPEKRAVRIVEQCHRESGTEPRGAGETPSLCKAAAPEKPIEGRCIVIGRYEIVGHIPGRDDTGQAIVERVDLFAEVRGVIDRLGIGVSNQNGSALTVGETKISLKRVVAGIAD